MNECGWCGKAIKGVPVLTIKNSPMVYSDGETEVELMPGYEVIFCCHGCFWAFSVEVHHLIGLSGKDLRNHIISEHGLKYPPGKPAGVMRRDCIVKVIAESLVSIINSCDS